MDTFHLHIFSVHYCFLGDYLTFRFVSIQVYGGGNTVVVGNKIHHNKCTGVYVSDRAAVSMQNNEISSIFITFLEL